MRQTATREKVDTGTKRSPNATIAVLTDKYLEGRKSIIDPVVQQLRTAGYGTLCITGRELDPTPRFHQDYSVCNSIYSEVRDYPIDGILMMSDVLGGNVSVSRLVAFVHQFAHLPVSSFGVKLPGVPSVVINESEATHELYDHLLSQRPAKKLLFICGRSGELNSLKRENGFRASATRHGYSADSLFFVKDNNSACDTYNDIVRLLLAHPDIGVIAAANDHMAESATRAAAACNLTVPDDILVTGFDDTYEAIRVYPALTTVRRPLSEAIERCTTLLLETIEHRTNETCEPPEQLIELKSEVILRGSTLVRNLEHGHSPVSVVTLNDRLATNMKGLQSPGSVRLDEISEAFWTTVKTGSSTLEHCLERNLKESPVTASTLHWWNNLTRQLEILSAERTWVSTDVNTRTNIAAAINRVRQSTWATSSDMEFSRQRSDTIKNNMQLQMSSCVKLPDILDTLDRWLKQTAIKRCFLACYSTPDVHIESQNQSGARLIYAYKDGVGEKTTQDVFSSSLVLPPPFQFEPRDGLLVQIPVSAERELFGYLLIDPTGLEHPYLSNAAQSIGHAMRSQSLIHKLKQKTQHLLENNRELLKLANYDELTGLPNRLQFNARLMSFFQEANTSNEMLALICIDLDGFKRVNDTLGHQAGDQLLCEVTQRLQSATSNLPGYGSFIARVGGDGFMVILAGIDTRRQVETIATNIIEEFSRAYVIKRRNINVGASIGMADFPGHSGSAEELIKNSDLAMYKAKEQGRNCAVWYTPCLGEINNTLLQLDNEMRVACKNGDIGMYYQPRVNIDTGKFCAVEALMRWTSKTADGVHERTSPSVFIEIAEKTGFITHLDMLALNESCRQARAWELSGTPILVAVNISVIHLQQDHFVDSILETL